MTTPSPRFLQALFRQPVDCTPVWLMRQAGRYLPEYRATRAQAGSFLKLCQTPELACEITLQPLRRFDFDAAILFSDILIVAEAMGLGLQVLEAQGPVITRPIRSAKEVASLPHFDPAEKLDYVLKTVQLLRMALQPNTPLIGFAGSPWTVAAYLVEGRGTKEFYLVRSMLYQAPEILHALLSYLAQATTAYLLAQVQAGAQALMLFDTWGNLLGPQHYLPFSLRYIKDIVCTLKQTVPHIPLILYSKNGGAFLKARADTGVHALGLDWRVDLNWARQTIGQQVALQGNLDPTVLYATPDVVRAEVKKTLMHVGANPGYIFNLGHGVPLDVPTDNIRVLVDTVHEFKLS